MKKEDLQLLKLLLSTILFTLSVYWILNNPKDILPYVVFGFNLFTIILDTKNLFKV